MATGLLLGCVYTVQARAAEPGGGDGLLVVQHAMMQQLTTENPDGSGQKDVGPVGAVSARWSADGKRLVYSDGIGFGVVNADGSGASSVGASRMYGTFWSAPAFLHGDGSVVFAATPVDSYGNYLPSQLFTAAADAPGAPKALTQPPAGYNDYEPATEGDTVVFIRVATPPDTPYYVYPVSHSVPGALMKLDVATGAITQVLDGALEPDISPDGTKVAFVRAVSGVDQLFTANIDGTNVQQVTTGTTGHEYPAWSPTGTRISYSTDGTPTENGSFTAGMSAIHVLKLADSSDTVADTASHGYSSWQPLNPTVPVPPAPPAGSTGAILGRQGGNLTLYSGGGAQVVAAGTDVGSGSWYSAADRVIFARNGTLYSTRRDGSDLQQVGPAAQQPYVNYVSPQVCADRSAVVAAEGYGATNHNLDWIPLTGSGAGIATTVASGSFNHPVCLADHSIIADDGTDVVRETQSGGVLSGPPAVVVHNATEPAVSADGRALAYIAPDKFGVHQLFVSGLDGSNPVPLTHGYRSVHSPAWSPDGSQIAVYDSGFGGIVEVSAKDGTPLGSIHGATNPSWEPPPYPAAQVPPPGSAGPISTVLNGNLVADPGGVLRTGSTGAAWFPTGSRYVYASGGSLFSSQPGGGSVTRLTSGSGSGDSAPSVSFDGAVVAFMRNSGIFLVASDGSQAGREYQVPLDQSFGTVAYSGVGFPSFARDGALLFTADGPAGHGVYRRSNGAISLFLAGASQLKYSPAGDRVAYLAPDAKGVTQLFIASANGASPRQLTTSDHQISHPAWSPDGSQIAYDDAQFGEVVEVSAADGATTGSAPGSFPAWIVGPGKTNVVRLWGSDRTGTAIAASQYVFADHGAADRNRYQAGAVVLSRDDLYADALGGSSLAVTKGGPLLITSPAALNPAVGHEISRVLAPGGTVYLLGGNSALSPAVERQVRALGFRVVRLAGADRFQTAIAIARTVNPHPSLVMLATGTNFKDALAAGATGEPLVLTDGKTMPAATAAYLNSLNPVPQTGGTTLVTVGGPGDKALVSGYQAGLMPSWPTRINRVPLVGAIATDTAVLVAKAFTFGNGQAAIATTSTWPDALSGGAMVGNLGGPLLLTDPGALYGPVAGYLTTQSGSLTAAVMLGGPSALPNSLIASLASAIGVPGHVGYVSLQPGTSATRPAAGGGAAPGPVTLRTSGPGAASAEGASR